MYKNDEKQKQNINTHKIINEPLQGYLIDKISNQTQNYLNCQF